MIGPTNAQTPEELTELAMSIAREKLNQAQLQAFEVRASLKEPYVLGAEESPKVEHETPPSLDLNGTTITDVSGEFDKVLGQLEGLLQPSAGGDAQAMFDAMRGALLPTESVMLSALNRCKLFLQGKLPLSASKLIGIQERARNRITAIGQASSTALGMLYAANRWPTPAGAMDAAVGEIERTVQEQKDDFGRAFVAAQWEAVLSGLGNGVQAMLSAMRDGMGAAIELERLKLDHDPNKDALEMERIRLGVLQRLAQAQLAFNRSQLELAEAELMIPLSEIDDAANVHSADAKLRVSLWRSQVDLAEAKVRGLSNISAAQINGSKAGVSVSSTVNIQ